MATVAQPSVTAPAVQQSGPATTQPSATRDTYNQRSLGQALNSRIKQSRILMVGAGGIGCELLKNLVLSGFGDIHIVDLDTIDLSNLNRQFLFRHEHIKKSKALVAKDAAQKFNPNVKITAHHANIKDDVFTVQWFGGFSLVLNALDNLDARRHVNRMCLAANVPLIESGTTGFNGQVQVIKKGVTACYDCSPKETPKSFPVCTIRSTPSQPIHCIVWAKSYLLNEVFGTSEDEAALDHSADSENANEIEELKREAEALRKIRASVGSDDFTQLLFDKVFNSDIKRLRSMEDMWKGKEPPTPKEYRPASLSDDLLRHGQKVWSLEENTAVFNDSLCRLSKRMLDMKKNHEAGTPDPIITFDKDDEDTLDFVTAAANIRSTIFGIDPKSRFDVKQMAGNIIPAIATTNAIVASLCVLQAFKVLRGDFGQAKEVFLTPFAPARLLASDRSRLPNPDCPVCSVFQTSVYVDLSRATLDNLVNDFLRMDLGYGDKAIAVNNEVGLLYDEDETENLRKTLADLGIKPNSFLTIIDEENEDTCVNVVINIQEAPGPLDKPIKGVDLDHIGDIPRRPKKETPAEAPVETNGSGKTNGKHALDGEVEIRTVKRPRSDSIAAHSGPKKLKTDTSNTTVDDDDDDVVIVIPSGGGPIVLDDD